MEFLFHLDRYCIPFESRLGDRSPGVGIIILAKQATRKYMTLEFEIFGVICGVLFVLGGVWQFFTVRVSLVPLVCIAGGVALLLSALFGKATD